MTAAAAGGSEEVQQHLAALLLPMLLLLGGSGAAAGRADCGAGLAQDGGHEAGHKLQPALRVLHAAAAAGSSSGTGAAQPLSCGSGGGGAAEGVVVVDAGHQRVQGGGDFGGIQVAPKEVGIGLQPRGDVGQQVGLCGCRRPASVINRRSTLVGTLLGALVGMRVHSWVRGAGVGVVARDGGGRLPAWRCRRRRFAA